MEKRSPRRGTTICRALLLGASLAAVGSVPAAYAYLVPGGGNPKSDCLVELDVTGVQASNIIKNGRAVTCTDGDACDTDGACNGSCTFEAAVCVNQTDPTLPTCQPPSTLTSLKGKAKGLSIPLPGLSGASCAATFTAVVPLDGKKKKTQKIGLIARQASKPKVDVDNRDRSIQLRCVKREGACPSNTTTTISSTTTTTAVVCGDGLKGTGEQCDPPCGAGCGAGQLCNDKCQCVSQSACTCGGPADPMQVLFRTIDGTGQCGEVLDNTGASLTVNADATPGLNCSGLYFGGRDNAVPLPNSVPNNGMSIANVCCSGTALTAFGATAAETGSNRNCTSTGCLFGAPLPVINPTNPGTSTCVLNRLSSPAVGNGDCALGSSELQAPLSSEIFLAGDSLFNCLAGDTSLACGSDAECGGAFPGVCPTGIQPCPVCRGPSGSESCFGGPNNGMACTPEATTAGEGFPTSQDCPPDPMNSIGSLPISFTLSTGTIEKHAVTLGTPRVFCGFCRDTDDTLCFEGNTRGVTCPQPVGSLHPCTKNADCAQPYESCEQNSPGAFAPGGGTAQTIRVFGTPAGDVTDRLEHAATLASVFCIPPTYDALIDNAANLPGPGAVSLPGFSQLQ